MNSEFGNELSADGKIGRFVNRPCETDKGRVEMKKYKYQLHAHTLPCSACSEMYPEELARALYEGGFSGCVITNHFINGNTGISRYLPWNEFVAEYEKDYLKLKKCAEKYGLDIIFGIEEHVGRGLEILCYGITPEFLYAHPELRERSMELWYKTLNNHGALCIQAHPFREEFYIPNPQVLPLEFIDGIEVYNADNSAKNNLEAEAFFEFHPELITTSGGDTHVPATACLGGIAVSERIRNEKELVQVLKSGEYELIKG